MKKSPLYTLLIATLSMLASCSLDDDDNTDSVTLWANENVEWYEAQKELKNPDGTPYYTVVSPPWSPSSEILMHWFNDRALTAGNLTPLETSTVDCKYLLRLYNGVAVDSSYTNRATYGDSLFRTKVTGVIDGWQIALQSMKAGDSVRIVMAYPEGYGASTAGIIPAYSSLQFDMKLVDIPFYETPNR